ncbi:MAG: hypothetical protein FWD35_05130 [Oscillospiraceae bacterium]|nr:hypothetical protein [Oscillospiraceae bacterium]
MDSVKSIAANYGMSESKVKSMLFRLRNDLKLHLQKEGFYDMNNEIQTNAEALETAIGEIRNDIIEEADEGRIAAEVIREVGTEIQPRKARCIRHRAFVQVAQKKGEKFVGFVIDFGEKKCYN